MTDVNLTISAPLDLGIEVIEYIGDSIDILIEPVGPLELSTTALDTSSIGTGGGINFRPVLISIYSYLLQPSKIIHTGNLTNISISINIGSNTKLDTGLTANEQVEALNSNRIMDLLLELKSVRRDPTNLSAGKTKTWDTTVLRSLQDDYSLGRRLIMYDVYLYNKTDKQKVIR